MSGAAGGDDVEDRLSEEERLSVLAGIYEDDTEKTVTGGYFHTFAAIEALLAARECLVYPELFLTLHDGNVSKRKYPQGKAVRVRASSIDSLRGYDTGHVRTVVGIHGQYLHVTETEGQIITMIGAHLKKNGRVSDGI